MPAGACLPRRSRICRCRISCRGNQDTSARAFCPFRESSSFPFPPARKNRSCSEGRSDNHTGWLSRYCSREVHCSETRSVQIPVGHILPCRLLRQNTIYEQDALPYLYKHVLRKHEQFGIHGCPLSWYGTIPRNVRPLSRIDTPHWQSALHHPDAHPYTYRYPCHNMPVHGLHNRTDDRIHPKGPA